MSKVNNLFQQYDHLISQISENELLFFQVGDFFEAFGDQAVLLNQLVNIHLTEKMGRKMSGIPIRSYENYIEQILSSGYNVVLAEQDNNFIDEELKIIKRSITRKITPGTWVSNQDNNFRYVLLAIYSNQEYHLFYADYKTGQANYKIIEEPYINSHLSRIDPVTILSNKTIDYYSIRYGKVQLINITKTNKPIYTQGIKLLEKYFIDMGSPMNFQWSKEQNNLEFSDHLLYNLEIVGKNQRNLIKYINYTQTSMGYRTLTNKILNPMIDSSKIQNYWNAVLDKNPISISFVDMHRLINHCKTVNQCLILSENIKKSLVTLDQHINYLPKHLQYQVFQLKQITIHKTIDSVINQDVNCGNGAFYKHPKIIKTFEEYEKIMNNINQLPSKLSISGQIKHNKIIGYFIECKNRLPEPFILKQGLSKVNRYTHQELIILTSQLNIMESRMKSLEEAIFQDILDKINQEKDILSQLANLIGELDFINNSIILHHNYNYHIPRIGNFKINQARHPIVEKIVDIFIDNDYNYKEKTAIITGPNMGGKSTFLKTIALNVIIAQSGLVVPSQLTLPIYNKIFTRIGANDNIFNGDSTFMIEMKECADILNNADENSLVIIDEIGRGTSTIDGLSLSIAITKSLMEIGSFNLISTHYNQLAKYFKKHSDILLLSMVNNITNQMNYKINPGICDDSFGLNVARIANIPDKTMEEAHSIFIQYKKKYNNIQI